jgi:hypothetical protein
MALVEAREGRIGATIVKFYKFCFSYDPSGEKFVLNATRLVGLGTWPALWRLSASSSWPGGDARRR